jgi:hypothetical protein
LWPLVLSYHCEWFPKNHHCGRRCRRWRLDASGGWEKVGWDKSHSLPESLTTWSSSRQPIYNLGHRSCTFALLPLTMDSTLPKHARRCDLSSGWNPFSVQSADVVVPHLIWTIQLPKVTGSLMKCILCEGKGCFASKALINYTWS